MPPLITQSELEELFSDPSRYITDLNGRTLLKETLEHNGYEADLSNLDCSKLDIANVDFSNVVLESTIFDLAQSIIVTEIFQNLQKNNETELSMYWTSTNWRISNTKSAALRHANNNSR